MIAILILLLLGAAAPATADTILISEVVTDSKQDHSESAGGNGTPYDLFPGTGTVSTVDEFVEIFNASLDPIDLTGYVLVFGDTSPSSYIFGTTRSGVTRYSPGSSLTKLLAGGFVVVGNPPGSMNNKVTVAVFDATNNKLNEVKIENGKSASAATESISRIWYGSEYSRRFFRDRITPLGVSNPAPIPVPEPPAWVLLALSGLAAAGVATRRRVSRGGDRRQLGSPPPRSSPA